MQHSHTHALLCPACPQAEVSPPAAVRGVDLAQQVWPPGAPSRPSSTVNLWMSPEGGYCDFHLAMGGASGGWVAEGWWQRESGRGLEAGWQGGRCRDG